MRNIYLDNRSLAEARRILDQALNSAGWPAAVGEVEDLPLDGALGRILAEPVFACRSSPHFHAAAMDGIAVRAADTFGATPRTPIRLRVPDRAIPVDTGDALPAGCDAVVMIEDVQEYGDEVEISEAATPWQHVRPVGEDFVAGEMLFPRGQHLRPSDLAVILAGGNDRVTVRRQPVVAIIPTGDELVSPEPGIPAPGEIPETNSRLLGGLVTEWGGIPDRRPITPDDPEQLRAALLEAVAAADIAVVNAGSSAGRDDYTAAIVAGLGQLLVHGVAIRPGKPIVLGLVQGKPVLGLPGYPVSLWLTADLFLKPLIHRFLGLPAPGRERLEAALTRRVVSGGGAEEFVRVKLAPVGGRYLATPLGRGAGALTTLARADGLLRIPVGSQGFNEGEAASIELLRPRSEIDGTIMAVGSHDLLLDILDDLVRMRSPGTRLSSVNVGSLAGMTAVGRGECHLAGVHLLDETSGEYNVPYVRRLLPGRKVVLVNLAEREQGLIVRPGNPRGIGGLDDLARGDVTFVNRQRGSGTRVLLDYELKRAGLDAGRIQGYDRAEYTHMAVAAAVASGAADAGLGIMAAARALGLDFIPLARERYDLLIPAERYEDGMVGELLATIRSADFRQRALDLGGYHLDYSGEEVWPNGK